MSSIGNKIVFSNNLRRLMAEQGVDRNKICKDLGVAYMGFKRPLVQIQSLGPKVAGNQQIMRFPVTFLYAKNQKKCVRIWPIAGLLQGRQSLRRVLIELTIIQNLNSFLSPPP